MYYKGGNMLHTIRQVMGNDSAGGRSCAGSSRVPPPDRHRQTGAGLHQRHRRGHPAAKVFEQYLTTTKIPVFEYRLDGKQLSSTAGRTSCRGSTCRSASGSRPDSAVRLTPTEAWQTVTIPLAYPENFRMDRNFYVISRRAE